jgi:hypothetical protein
MFRYEPMQAIDQIGENKCNKNHVQHAAGYIEDEDRDYQRHYSTKSGDLKQLFKECHYKRPAPSSMD